MVWLPSSRLLIASNHLYYCLKKDIPEPACKSQLQILPGRGRRIMNSRPVWGYSEFKPWLGNLVKSCLKILKVQRKPVITFHMRGPGFDCQYQSKAFPDQ